MQQCSEYSDSACVCVCVYTEAQGVPKDFRLLLSQEAEGHSVYLCIMYCIQECVRVCTCLLVCFCVIPMGLLKQRRTVQLQIPVLICFFLSCTVFKVVHTQTHTHTSSLHTSVSLFPLTKSWKAAVTCSLVFVFLKSLFTVPSSFYRGGGRRRGQNIILLVNLSK